jgi:hypothetical protein
MDRPKTLILTAVLPESQALKKGLHLQKVAAPFPFWHSNSLALAQIGIRASRLPSIAQSPISSSVTHILLAGLAGALSPDLHIGDIIIDASAHPSPARLPPTATPGKIHMSPTLLTTPTAKHQLFSQTSCLAVDMESEIVRQFARERGAAFLHVRAISDTAGDTLDPQLLKLVDNDGCPRIGRAMAMLCCRPAALPAMLRLQKATALALVNLTNAVKEILASDWPSNGE